MGIETIIPVEVMGRMQQAADRAATGMRDRDTMRQACAEMDRRRDELRKRVGTIDCAVDLVREARNP